jgi:hypothetical protein
MKCPEGREYRCTNAFCISSFIARVLCKSKEELPLEHSPIVQGALKMQGVGWGGGRVWGCGGDEGGMQTGRVKGEGVLGRRLLGWTTKGRRREGMTHEFPRRRRERFDGIIGVHFSHLAARLC